MDATTKQKTLSVFLVALLVGSVLVTGLAAASHNGDPTRQPGANRERAVVDKTVSYSQTNATGSSIVNNVTEPSGGIIFNNTYDFTVTGLNGTTSTSFRLYKPTAFSGGAYTYVAQGNPVTAYDDEAHIGKVNVTFFAQTFDTVGVWLLSSGAGETAAFYVSPQTNLQVVVNPSTFVYAAGGQFVEITVTNLSSGSTGQAVTGAAISGFNVPSGSLTGTSGAQAGKVLYSAQLPGVGSYTVEAKIDTNSDSLPEFYGKATVTVAAAVATITPVDTTVRSGFAENASFDIAYPNGSAVFRSYTATTLANAFQWLNLSVVLPNGSTQFANYSSGTPGACQASFARSAIGSVNNLTTAANCPAGDAGVWEFSAGGRFYFRPSTQWAAGTYTVSFRASVVGTADADYVAATASISTSSPAAVNLKLHNVTSGVRGDEIKELRVQNSVVGTSLGSYTVDLQILGAASNEVPLSSFFSGSNITVSGAVLPISATGSIGTMGAPGAGYIRISGLVPTDVGGMVHIDITWKDQTTRISVPITSGASSTVDKTEIVVDQTSTLTVTVKDAFGNPVPTASVVLLNTAGANSYPGLVNQVINGTGAPGLGQNGQYTFNVRPTATGDLVVYSVIGAVVNGVNNQNFTYERVRVVPAHDLAITLSKNVSMAGNRTQVTLGATTAEGHGVTSSGNYRVYFLNQTTLAELRLNGTSALTGITSPQVLGGTSQANVEVGGELTTGVNLNVSLDPGTYYVYVCSNQTSLPATSCTDARHDNINNTPTFVAHPWHVTYSPERIASNPQIQGAATVTATVRDMNGVAPPTGSAITVRTASPAAPITSVTSTNATGVFTFVATPNGAIGDIVFDIDVSGAPTHKTAVDTAFKVVGPNVQVTPDRIPLGRAATLVISVKSLNGTSLPNLSVKVCGTPIGGNTTNPGCTGDVYSDAAGMATVGVNPFSTGTLTLYVNNVSSNVNVTVFSGLDLQLSRNAPQANETQDITVSIIGQSGGAGGVLVNVTRDGAAVSGFPQTTGSSGRVLVPSLAVGNYTVRATLQGYEPATATFTVTEAVAAPVNRAVFALGNLTVPATATVGQGITVTAEVSNTGNADGTANVLLLVNGAVRDSQQVPVAAGRKETVAFDFTPNTAGSFTVTVKLATGETAPAKTVTVGTPATTSPVTTSPVTTSPVTTSPVTTSPVTTSPVTTSPVTSPTPATTDTVEPSIPGFEVVALLGALAVALLVLRRRN